MKKPQASVLWLWDCEGASALHFLRPEYGGFYGNRGILFGVLLKQGILLFGGPRVPYDHINPKPLNPKP